ncbi:hypothetical protein MNBD_GAMMA21-227 [hydrothermal vent metagenome]|uniref:SPOR domain-containing protein n=1 Tax=hydrothermal vent metagenome TaxID=652676 RepID=A0A3B1AKZ0_9ZZZZ
MLRSGVFIATLGLFNLPVSATSTLQALDAQDRGDFQTAAILWQQLANEGNALAQYNLALLYKLGEGVKVDENMSNYWLTMAARQGIVQAYQSLNTNSVQATQQRLSVKPLSVIGPQQWVASQNPRYYTLQLASSTNKQLIEKYYSLNDLSGKAGYYSSMRQGERWYALVYGSYNSVHTAKSAISDLPQNLRKWSPWVRNIRSIHKIMITE